MRWLYLALVVTGCATAGKDEGGLGRPDGGRTDGSTRPPIDAPPLPDAPPGQQQITLSQTNDMTPAAGKGIACGYTDFFGGTADNSWYRVFKLTDHQVNGAFNVQRVTFYSDYSLSGLGSLDATLKIGTYSGTLDADTLTTGSITPITSMPITIPDNTGAPAAIATNISATIPAGSNLIVEVALDDAHAIGEFYIGVSAGGETKKGYIRATPSGCNMTTPKSLTSPTGLNKPDNSILLTVTGTK